DETSGVDPLYHYTHAYNLGTDASAVINGVSFKGVAGNAPSEGGKFAVTGTGNVYNGDTNNIFGDGSGVLARDFIYNGNPGTLTLQGLEPNKEYVLTLYSAGWENTGGRFVNFTSGESRLFLDQDVFGNDNGVLIVHRYTSSAEGTAQISFQ